jgi:hypothetical protein
MATIQAALKRGITQTFQIEESELVVEPLPNSNERKSLLFYEAAEGGAGVLSRLAQSRDQMAVVARAALELIHYRVEPHPQAFRVSDLEKAEQLTPSGTRVCEAGCYQCLLSYYNQPDHEHIQRRSPEVLGFLAGLAQSTVKPTSASESDGAVSQQNGALEAWLSALRASGRSLPDRTSFRAAEGTAAIDAIYQAARVMVLLQPPTPELRSLAADKGYSVLEFSPDPASWEATFIAHANVFGPASAPAP